MKSTYTAVIGYIYANVFVFNHWNLGYSEISDEKITC
jgi:hypothetical protein